MVLSVLRVFLLFDKINYDTAEKLQKLKSIEDYYKPSISLDSSVL